MEIRRDPDSRALGAAVGGRADRQGQVFASGGEDRFRATVELAQIGLVHVSLDARWLFVNDHFCRIVGYPRDALLARTIPEITHPDDRGTDLAHARRLIAGEIDGYRLEKRYIRRDGRPVWVDLTVWLMRDRDGAPQCMIAVVQDIDERKRAAVALREREARLQLLTEAGAILGRSLDLDAALRDIVDLLVPVFADWCVISTLEGSWVERRALRHRDPAQEELLRQWPQRYELEPDQIWGVGHVLLTGQVAFHPHGSLADVGPEAFARAAQFPASQRLGTTSQVVVPLVARGQVLGAINVCLSRRDRHYDETDLATLEELARRAALALDNARLFRAEQIARAEAERLAERLQLAQAAGRIGTFVWDIASDAVAWTPELEALYGLPPGGFGGRYENWRRAVHPGDVEEAERAVRAAATGTVLETSFRIVRPDGTVRHLLAHGRVVRDADGRAQMIGVNVDVTEREEALAAAEAAVRARDVFLSIAAHELRTPITALKGSAQLLVRQEARGMLDPARRARTLGVLNDAADRLAALTDDLLDVSRIRTGQLPLALAPLDLPALVGVAVAHARARHGGPHRIVLDAPGGLSPVSGDAARLDQVLTNLLDNAIKYSPGGGDVVVAVRAVDGGLLTTVRDGGIGLPPGSAEVIFEPFGRAPNAARSHLPGLGLGLYICRSIVERHDGRIWAESAGEGQGTTVALWLPGGEDTAREVTG